jgi:hypothetical protein
MNHLSLISYGRCPRYKAWTCAGSRKTSHVVTLILACGADGKGFVGMALAGTRKDFEDFEDLLLELVEHVELDSRDIRSRTICGMSTR